MNAEVIRKTAALRKKEQVLTPGKIVWKRFCRNKIALAGLLVLGIFTLMSICAPLLTSHSPTGMDSSLISQKKFLPPGGDHLLGTDSLGRDIWARLLYGGRVSMTVGIVATALSLAIGVSLGSLAGYKGGLVDSAVMRLTDIFLSFPFLPLAIAVATILSPSIYNTMLVIGFLGWTGTCRLVRGQFLQIRNTEYVEATRALGLKNYIIIWKHMLPNALAPLLINATLGMASAILVEAALSFIGLGVQPPQPSWGNMLEAARNIRVISNNWWIWAPPGTAIFLTVLSINMVGDGLRDALDPRLKL